MGGGPLGAGKTGTRTGAPPTHGLKTFRTSPRFIPPSLQKIDDCSVVAIIAHVEVKIVTVAVELDDDLVRARAHHG
jgi:hypothetical protein